MFSTQADFMSWWMSIPWNSSPFWLSVILVILLGSMCYPWGRRWNMGSKRGKAHGWKECFADILTEAIEQGVHTGKITRKTARRAYLECAQKFGLDDLRRKSKSYKAGSAKIAWLKAQIEGRIEGDVKDVKAMPIPDPGPVTYQAPPARKKKLALS